MVVFACSLGMDMKFNASYHKESSPSLSSHHHKSKVKHQEDDKDNCCKDKAVKFVKVDKLNPQASYAGVNPVFFPAFLSNFFYFNILESGSNIYINKFAVLGYHPPLRDIRIAIQSFQI
jgi:hypothetical protein